MPGIGEEPQGRGAEQQREHVVHVAHEWADVQARCRNDGHRTEHEWAPSESVSDRCQRQDHEHLPARHEQRGDRVPVHVAHLANQRTQKRCGDSVAASEDAQRAVGEYEVGGRMAREHLGPPRVPGHVRTGRQAARIGHERPQPREGNPRREEQDRNCLAGPEQASEPLGRYVGSIPGPWARPERGHVSYRSDPAPVSPAR
jgi:hypothetical protein